jgi:hypothetical protein
VLYNLRYKTDRATKLMVMDNRLTVAEYCMILRQNRDVLQVWIENAETGEELDPEKILEDIKAGRCTNCPQPEACGSDLH